MIAWNENGPRGAQSAYSRSWQGCQLLVKTSCKFKMLFSMTQLLQSYQLISRLKKFGMILLNYIGKSQFRERIV